MSICSSRFIHTLISSILLSFNTFAATITVSTTDDTLSASGCSLRAAIMAANLDSGVGGCSAGDGVDTIILPAGNYVLSRAGSGEDFSLTGDLDIHGSLKIQGAGAANTIIDGAALDRVFHIVSLAGVISETVTENVEFYGLTIQNGLTSGLDQGFNLVGGGLLVSNTAALLTLKRIVIRNNHAQSGGAIAAFSPVLISQSAIISNTANSAAGAYFDDAHFDDYYQILDSTISGNSASGVGGIVLNQRAYPTFRALIIKNSTITDNEATGTFTYDPNSLCPRWGPVGGIYVANGSPYLKNSILAGNRSIHGHAPDCGLYPSPGPCGAISIWPGLRSENSIIGDYTGCTTSAYDPQQTFPPAIDPKLDSLTPNTFGIPVHKLLVSSPAIDNGSPEIPGTSSAACSTHDANGQYRSLKGSTGGSCRCDIGAVEYIEGSVDNSLCSFHAAKVSTAKNTCRKITLKFNRPIDTSKANKQHVQVKSKGTKISIKLSSGATTGKIAIQPKKGFWKTKKVVVTLKSGFLAADGVTQLDGDNNGTEGGMFKKSFKVSSACF